SPRHHQPPYTFRRRQPDTTRARFPHSDPHGSKLGCQLPAAYRDLPRPSSAPGDKASTVGRTHFATTDTRCSRTLSTNQNTSHKPTYNTIHGKKPADGLRPGWHPGKHPPTPTGKTSRSEGCSLRHPTARPETFQKPRGSPINSTTIPVTQALTS